MLPVRGLEDAAQPQQQEQQHKQTASQQGGEGSENSERYDLVDQQGLPAPSFSNGSDRQEIGVDAKRGKYCVVLDGVTVTYDVCGETGKVVVMTAAVLRS